MCIHETPMNTNSASMKNPTLHDAVIDSSSISVLGVLHNPFTHQSDCFFILNALVNCALLMEAKQEFICLRDVSSPAIRIEENRDCLEGGC